MDFRYELTRVIIFFPVKRTTILVIDDLINQLYKDFGGLTISEKEAPVFDGYWLEPLEPEPQIEPIMLFIIDVDQRLDDARLIYFSKLKKWLQGQT